MAELLAIVTRKGQVTIPAEVRKALALQRGDLVAFTLPEPSNDRVTIRRAPSPTGSVVEQLFGSLRSSVPAMAPEQENESFEEGIALDAERSLTSGDSQNDRV